MVKLPQLQQEVFQVLAEAKSLEELRKNRAERSRGPQEKPHGVWMVRS
jgi:hypothetical protein